METDGRQVVSSGELGLFCDLQLHFRTLSRHFFHAYLGIMEGCAFFRPSMLAILEQTARINALIFRSDVS